MYFWDVWVCWWGESGGQRQRDQEGTGDGTG